MLDAMLRRCRQAGKAWRCFHATLMFSPDYFISRLLSVIGFITSSSFSHFFIFAFLHFQLSSFHFISFH